MTALKQRPRSFSRTEDPHSASGQHAPAACEPPASVERLLIPDPGRARLERLCHEVLIQ